MVVLYWQLDEVPRTGQLRCYTAYGQSKATNDKEQTIVLRSSSCLDLRQRGLPAGRRPARQLSLS